MYNDSKFGVKQDPSLKPDQKEEMLDKVFGQIFEGSASGKNS